MSHGMRRRPGEHVPTVVIGAGQAGLAVSRCLTDRHLDHLVLERGRVAERWRSQRWTSFTLLSPNWQTRLPGYRYSGPAPDGFMTGGEVADFLDRYAASSRAPVRTGVEVTRVLPEGGGWRVRTGSGDLCATNVVVATGDLAEARVPPLAQALAAGVTQLHTSSYRDPAQLPGGGVLVVGAGPSGQQIALELARSGRRVHIAVGRHKTMPRRYRGQDAYWWMDRMGMLDRTVDSLPGSGAHRRSPNAVLAGGVRDLDVRRLVAEGVVAHGRLTAVDGPALTFADDLPATLADAEGNAARFRASVDAFVARTGLAAPVEAAPQRRPVSWLTGAPRDLDLQQAGITTVIWATGFRRDFSWLDAPVLDDRGEPVHRRGVTAADGLFFLGLRWQYRRSSSFLDGVGRDAEHLAEQIAARACEALESAA